MSNEKEHRPSELRMIPLDRIEVLTRLLRSRGLSRSSATFRASA